MKQVWEYISESCKDDVIIWLSDTACSKIHLNAKFYSKDFDGIEVAPTAEGYLIAYDVWLRRKGIRFVSAMREAQEMYAVLDFKTKAPKSLTLPIPYM